MKFIKQLSWVLILSIFSTSNLFAQKTERNLYKPEADARAEIATHQAEAKESGKHLILQVGGNWCGWCYKFHDFVNADSTINALVEENYVVYHLNYSKENKNLDVLSSYAFPQRFGFPVFVILDGDGNRIHTQDSWLLESGKSYDTKKVQHFFKTWTPAAVSPESY